MVAHACNPSAGEMKAGGLECQSHPESQSGLCRLMSQIKISNKNFKRAKEMAQWVKGLAVQV